GVGLRSERSPDLEVRGWVRLTVTLSHHHPIILYPFPVSQIYQNVNLCNFTTELLDKLGQFKDGTRSLCEFIRRILTKPQAQFPDLSLNSLRIVKGHVFSSPVFQLCRG
ncbi:MAG: hypothetical protein WCA07_11425, partial [Gloeobacterales cyanobacterium]